MGRHPEGFRGWGCLAEGDSTGTKKETEALIADLKRRNVPHLAGKEAEVTADQLQNNRIIFLFTELDDNQIVYQNNNFREYLKASLLSAAKEKAN